MGQVGLEWQVAGFGPINGAGTSDMLMRNSQYGRIRDLRHRQQQHHQRGSEWARSDWNGRSPASPPIRPAMQRRQLLLAQAMASYAPAGGILNANEPLGEATTQLSSANSLAVQMPHANQA